MPVRELENGIKREKRRKAFLKITLQLVNFLPKKF